MRRSCPIRAFLVALLLAAWTPLAARADEPEITTDDREIVSIFSGDVHVPAGVRQLGDVVVIGGKARIEGSARNVVVILGELELTGSLDGDVVSLLSDQRLVGARIDGDYVSILGTLGLQDSQVHGEFVNLMSRLERDGTSTAPLVNLGAWIPGLMALLFWVGLLKLFLIFLLLLLIVGLAPERVRLIGEEAPPRYATAFFTGLLTYLAILAIWTLMMLSLVGIPFFYLAYWPLKWLGIAGLFFAFGRRLGRSVGRELSVLGAVLGVFAIYSVLSLLPTAFGLWGLPLALLLRATFFLVVEVPALGLLVLTRLGTRRPHESPPPAVTALATPL